MTKHVTYDDTYLSDCHNARVYIVGGAGDFSDYQGGITLHYTCDECKEMCNFHPKSEPAPMTEPAWREDLDVVLGMFDKAKAKTALRTIITSIQAEAYKAGQIDELKKVINLGHTFGDGVICLNTFEIEDRIAELT